MAKESKTEKKPASAGKLRFWRRAGLVALLLIGLLAALVVYFYAVSPAVVRQPQLEHYHFRMQVIADGRPVDFGAEKFQTSYDTGSCDPTLPDSPIHFHDRKDQMVHIHWEGMTGGLVLKNYGWNYVGGPAGALGYRFDQLPQIMRVPIHSRSLPAVPADAGFYVYSGDEQGFKKRDFDDFLNQDLEKFFGRGSNFPGQSEQASWLDLIFPPASAHAGEDHSAPGDEAEAQRLSRINNLIGNVVIFVQKSEPSEDQVKARFNNLEPLSDSSCGG